MIRTSSVLLVDDNELLTEAYQLLLGDHGFRVITARSGQEALNYCGASENEPVLAIIDLKMPGLDGPATIRALRGTSPGLKVIAVSGQMLGPYFGRLADLGVRHFLPKPYSVDSLLEEIRDVMPMAG